MTLSQPMIIFALRYCLYSASYALMACTRFLADHWSEFSPDFQTLIVAELQQRLASQKLSLDIAQTWEHLLRHAMWENDVGYAWCICVVLVKYRLSVLHRTQ